ncbi:MAG: hypothetical protein AAGL10_10325 [Pseudomonadota bacterium]
MFGPDTALMFDAIQMVGLAAGVAGAAVYLLMRRRKTGTNRRAVDQASELDLEQRVRVLERIATDRSAELADEIEALRDDTKEGSTI